jgi:hypothetical protein
MRRTVPPVPRYLTLAEAATISRQPEAGLMALATNGSGPAVAGLSSRERILFRDDLLNGWMVRRAGYE